MKKIIPRFVSWPHQLFFLRRFRLEYGNQKVIICHISKDERIFFYKTYKDIFELSQIEKYGFSKDIYGKNLAEHKCVSIHKYAFMESYFQPALREIVFVLKDGRTVVFEGANFTHGQLCGLVSYIEENIGIRPTGRLSASLLVASFTEEKINFALDMIQFPEKELQNAQLRVDDTYFMKEAIVICKSGQMVYFPYDKLQAVLFYAKTRNRFVRVAHSGFSCCYWLKNGEHYGCMLKSREDFEKIADFMQLHHPEIEADAELIYEGMFY